MRDRCYQPRWSVSRFVALGLTANNLRSAYSREQPFGDLLQDALVLPIFDGGNVGVRRRQIEAIFGSEGYDPWESTFGADSKVTANGGEREVTM